MRPLQQLLSDHPKYQTYFLMARHPETIENVQGIHQGRTVSGTVTPQGHEQWTALIASLADVEIDQVLCSPIGRCNHPAQQLLTARPALRKMITFPDALLPMNSGSLAHLSRASFYELVAQQGIPYWMFATDGESLHDVQGRSVRYFYTQFNQAIQTNKQTTLVISNGSIITTFLLFYYHTSLDEYDLFIPKNAEPIVFGINKHQPLLEIQLLNEDYVRKNK